MNDSSAELEIVLDLHEFGTIQQADEAERRSFCHSWVSQEGTPHSGPGLPSWRIHDQLKGASRGSSSRGKAQDVVFSNPRVGDQQRDDIFVGIMEELFEFRAIPTA